MSTAIPQPATTAKYLTADDLLAMPDGGEGYELVDGRLVRKGMGSKSSYVNRRVSRFVGTYADDNDLGWVFESECGYQCFPYEPNRVRKPDVSFIRKDRLPEGDLPDGWLRIRPDLAVEVISSKDRAEKLFAKLADYRAIGVPLVWVVDPKSKTVVVQVAGQPTQRVFEAEEELTGGDVLPGFSVKVSDLFPKA